MILEIKGIEVDLKRIGINFMPNSEQIAALNHLADFMKSDKLTTVLSGSAGSGKTSLMRIFIEYDRIKHRSNVRLIAPTHKAKSILNRLSNKNNATTLHALLGLKPDFNVLEFDARTVSFLDSLNLIMFETERDLMIVDECSMINDELYDMLVKKMGSRGKIIFLGDFRQLRPVKQGFDAKVFSKTDFPGINLNIVERQQDNPLVNTLVKLRTNAEVVFESDDHAEKGLRVHDLPNFQMILTDSFISLEDYNKIPQSNRILAYTNKRVAAFNRLARKLMACNKNPINVGELLLAYDSYSRNFEEVLANGCEYTVVNFTREDKYLPSYGLFPGYTLVMQIVGDSELFEIFLLDPEADAEHYKNLAIVTESLRLKAIKKKYLWKNFFALNEAYITMHDLVYQGRVLRKRTVDYGYSTTVHKSLNWLL